MREFGVIAFLLVSFGIAGYFDRQDEQRIASLSAADVILKCRGRENPEGQAVQKGARLVSHPDFNSDTRILECRVTKERS